MEAFNVVNVIQIVLSLVIFCLVVLSVTVRNVLNSQAKALAGVAHWTECQPVNQRVAGSVPMSGYMPGLWARSPVGGM